MSDYRLELKIKNNPFLRVIESRGAKTVGEAIRVLGLPHAANDIANLKTSAYRADGAVRATVVKVCEILDCLPEDIFPDENLFEPLNKNKLEAVISSEQARQLSYQADEIGVDNAIDRARLGCLFDSLGTVLTEREVNVMRMRYEDGMTLRDVGRNFDVTATRVRQIEEKALRKLRNPAKNAMVVDIASVYGVSVKQ